MTKNYIVHGANDAQVQTDVTLGDGSTVQAMVPAFNVELTPTNGEGSAINLPFYGAAIADAKATFVDGATVTVSFA